MSSAREAYQAIRTFLRKQDDAILTAAFQDIQKRHETGLMYGGALIELRKQLDFHLNEMTTNPLKALEDAICFELAERYCKLSGEK